MSLSEELTSLLSDLATQIDTNLTLLYYSKLADSEQKDSSFLSKYFCQDQGAFIINTLTCSCDLGMFNNHCQDKGIDYWKGWFTFFKFIFGGAYGILLFIFWISLIIKIVKDFYEKELFKRMICTPKYLIYFNLVIFSTSRFFYIVIDPFCQLGIIKHMHDSMVFYMTTTTLICFYIQILVIWLGILAMFNLGLGKINHKCFTCMYNRVKIVSVVIMIILYPVELIVNYVIAKRDNNLTSTAIIIVSGAILVCIFFVMSLILMRNLKRKFDILYGNHKQETGDIYANICSRFLVNEDTKEFVGSEMSNDVRINNKKDVIDFIAENYDSEIIPLVEMFIFEREEEFTKIYSVKKEIKNQLPKRHISKTFSIDSEADLQNVKDNKCDFKYSITKGLKFKPINELVHTENSILADNESDNEFLHEHLNTKTSRKISKKHLFLPNSNYFETMINNNSGDQEKIINKCNTYGNKEILSGKSRFQINKDFLIDNTEQFEYKLDYETELNCLDCFKDSEFFTNNNDSNDANSSYSPKENDHQHKGISSLEHTQILIKSNNISPSLVSGDQINHFSQNPITKKDSKIIYNIFCISIAFLVLVFIVFYCFLFLNIDQVRKSKPSQIIVFYILFTTEIICLVLVYNLFFRDRQGQEYQSLKMISDFHKYLNPNENEEQSILVFNKFTSKKVFHRFKNFIKYV